MLQKESSNAANVSEDMISPFVIVNKTDLSIVIKRLIKREEGDQHKVNKIKNIYKLRAG